jgi:hypothetical protein
MKPPYEPEQFSEEQVKSIFGPASNSGLAHQLIRRDPAKYAAMKQVACYRDNLIPESALPLDSRLTKQELEEHHERQTAGDLIPVPLDLAAQFGIAPGTRLPKSKVRALQGKAE